MEHTEMQNISEATSPAGSGHMTQLVEEELISQAMTGAPKLPMLDIIFSRMAIALVSTFKMRAAFLCDISFDNVVYKPWDDIVDMTDPFGICATVEARPWGGSMSVIMDGNFIFSALETQLGGTPKPGTAPKRPVTKIESQIARGVVELALHDLSENISRLTNVTFVIDGMETPQQMPAMHGGKSVCAVARMKITIGEVEGYMDIVLPLSTIEPAQDILSKMFFGENLGGDVSWRDHILSNIHGSTVKVTAQVHELDVPLKNVLEWGVGDVVDLGIDSDQSITLMCHGVPVFQGYAGYHKNGKISVRVENDVDDLVPDTPTPVAKVEEGQE
jgi:flagellar motor switch protein FliM